MPVKRKTGAEAEGGPEAEPEAGRLPSRRPRARAGRRGRGHDPQGGRAGLHAPKRRRPGRRLAHRLVPSFRRQGGSARPRGRGRVPPAARGAGPGSRRRVATARRSAAGDGVPPTCTSPPGTRRTTRRCSAGFSPIGAAIPTWSSTANAAFNILADTIRGEQERGRIGPGDPIELAEITWALSHGIATLGLAPASRAHAHERRGTGGPGLPVSRGRDAWQVSGPQSL